MKIGADKMNEATDAAHLLVKAHHQNVLDSVARNTSLQQQEHTQFDESIDISRNMVWHLSNVCKSYVTYHISS